VSEPDDANKAMLDAVTGCASVALHIRRGDYVSVKKNLRFNGVCSVEYYQAALDLLLKKVEHPHAFIFSDDIPWARENLHLNIPTTFVDHNDARRDYEDLRLLSHCRHHIIANSTFSWWGAWLAAWPGQVVIAPRRWFRSKAYNTKDIVPEHWLRL
ncbi:MAG TPA: alpha-1,2-fucosyltransferase, partial [Armatimonadota bacterium]